MADYIHFQWPDPDPNGTALVVGVERLAAALERLAPANAQDVPADDEDALTDEERADIERLVRRAREGSHG